MYSIPYTKSANTAARPRIAYFLSHNYQISPLIFLQRLFYYKSCRLLISRITIRFHNSHPDCLNSPHSFYLLLSSYSTHATKVLRFVHPGGRLLRLRREKCLRSIISILETENYFFQTARYQNFQSII